QEVNTLPFHKPDWDDYRRLLAEAVPALVNGAALAEVKFVVHTSFASLYGDTHGEWADEQAEIVTDSPLFAAAVQAEEAVLHGGAPGCVLRAGFNYGPDSQSTIALRHALISRGTVNVGQGAASWIHSSDLVQAILQAVVQQPAGEIFNIADDQPTSAAEFVDAFADRLGVRHPSKTNLPDSLRQVLVPADERALLDASVKVSTAKAKAQLGLSLQYATIQAGIDQTLLAWRATEAV
ncbi:MAG: NAD-dependent epimerase/dehydratase family protein, partial [Anaerolineae bacterium]|nr:NAD-dependent epimerase/dehydratase family protein [Anaerolineae bacterium]